MIATDSELITIEQALRLATRGHGPQSYTIEKVREALAIIQAVPHSTECDCDYCHERREKADPLVRFSFRTTEPVQNPYLCSVAGCGFYRNDDSEFCSSHF